MPEQFSVPLAAQRAAGRALATHRQFPDVEGVTGLSVAERLVSGTVDADTIGKLHRFFLRNTTAYTGAINRLQSEETDGLVRSWALHGAEMGQAFANSHYLRLVREGALPEDPLAALFELSPEQVYGRFQAGAWRWEYGLTPRTAAEFVHYYHAKTDQSLDLTKAFGESSSMAVANQLHRRFHTPTPFEIARKALKIDDWSLQQAAKDDLAAFKQNPVGLVEASLPWKKLHNTSAKLAAIDSWPTLLAYIILAVEAPDLLVDLNKSSSLIPTLATKKPKHWAQYHDAINIWLMYFHPTGKRYHDPKESDLPKYESLEADMAETMFRAFRGKKLHAPKMKKLLRVARDWVHVNKKHGQTFAGTFHVLINYWKKGAWAEILDSLPQDADVRPAFEQFVKLNKMPEGGVELSQKLASNSPEYKAIQKDVWVGGKKQVSLEHTETFKHAKKIGTPIGVKAVLKDEEGEFVLLSAVETSPGKYDLVLRGPDGKITSWDDGATRDEMIVGNTVVTHAHAELPGSVYAAPTTAPSVSPKLFGTQAAADYVLKDMKGTPVAKEDDPQFTLVLGTKMESNTGSRVTLVGYARKNTMAQYIVQNMSGGLAGVSPGLIKKWYAAGTYNTVGYDAAVIAHLIPPPEVGITVTPALKEWLEASMPGGYTLLTPQGTAFEQAAKAKGWKVYFGQEWVRHKAHLTFVACAVEEGQSHIHIIFRRNTTDTHTSVLDTTAAGHVTTGVIVPAGQVDTPSTSDATKPKIPANAIGTPGAKAFADKFNMTLVTKAYSPLLKAELGGLYQSKTSDLHYLVIGYARDTVGTAPQIIAAAVGVDDPSDAAPMPWNAKGFNEKFTGPISYNQSVIDSLLTVAKPNLPTDIIGTTKAQQVAKGLHLALALPVSPHKFQIGDLVKYGASINTVIGYGRDLDLDDEEIYVLADPKGHKAVTFVTLDKLGQHKGYDTTVLDDGYVTDSKAKVTAKQVQQAKDTAQPTPEPDDDFATSDPWTLIKDEFPGVSMDVITELKSYGATSFAKAMKKHHDFKLVPGSQFKNAKAKVFTILGAFKFSEEVEGVSEGEEFDYGPGTLFVYAMPDGGITSDDSGDLAQGVKDDVLMPVTAGDLDALAQQNKLDAQQPDAQAKATGADGDLWPNEAAIKAVAQQVSGSEYTIIAPQDIDVTTPGDKFNTSGINWLSVGSMWMLPQFDEPVEVLGAYVADAADGTEYTMLVFRNPDGEPETLSATTVQKLLDQGQMYPATQAAPKVAPTELPTPFATEEELGELADFPEAFVEQLITPPPGEEYAALEVEDPDDVSGNQVPLANTLWAKAAKTNNWTVAKGDKWEWITYEEGGNTVFTVMGAIDVGEHKPEYYILAAVESPDPKADVFIDANLREALYADRLFPWNVLPKFDDDTQTMLTEQGLTNAAQVPLSLTLFGVAAKYQGFAEFAVEGAAWQETYWKGHPKTVIGAIEGTAGYLLIVQTEHGKPQLANDLNWANLVEENKLEPVGVPTTVELPFDEEAMAYIMKNFTVKVFQVKGVELDSLSVAFAAQKAGFAYSENTQWYRVGVDSEPFTLRGAFSITGGAVYVLVQYPDGKYESFPANQQEQQLLSGLLLPGDVTGVSELEENAQSFAKSKFGLTDAELAKAVVPLQYTQSAKGVKAHKTAWELTHGSVWVWPSTTKQIAVWGAIVGNDGAVHLIVRDAEYKDVASEVGFSTHPDTLFLDDVVVGGLIPLSEYTPPAYTVGDLLTYQGSPHLVLAYAQKAYLLQPLWLATVASPLKEVKQPDLEEHATVTAQDVQADALMQYVGAEAGFEMVSDATKPETWPDDNATVQVGPTKGVYVGGIRSTVDAEAEYAILLVQKTADFYSTPVTYHALVPYKGTLFKPITSSYADLGISVDTPVELAGIQGAFDYTTAQNYTVAAKSESPEFQFHLGEIRTSKADETRIVVGYAFHGDTPHYILASNMELTSFTQKTATKAHDQYGPYTGLHPDVRNNMLPKPGEAAPVIPVVPDPVVVSTHQKVTPGAAPDALSVSEYFSPGEAPAVPVPTPPKATYPITARAEAWMQKQGEYTEFVEPPTNARFHTYTTAEDGILRYTKASGTDVPAKVLGWVYGADGYRVVLDLDPSKPVRRYAVVSAETLKQRAWAESAHKQVIGDDEGGVTITDNPKEGEVHIEMPDLWLPHDPGPGWEYPAPIAQPAMNLEAGKSVAAGCVAVLPPGTKLTGGGKTYEAEYPMIMLVHPRNQFGGPLSFPKGRVDKGEGLTRAAVREVWEETGVKVKPVDILRNFKKGKPHTEHASQIDWTGTTTVTRYYIGYVIGGHPQRFGWEADSVTFKPLVPNVEKTKWYKKLSTRDRAVVQKVVWWLAEHGGPSNYTGQPGTYDVQVTDATDAAGQALPAVKADPWLSLIQHAPFPVTEAMLAELRQTSTVLGAPQSLVAGVGAGAGMPAVGTVGSLDGEAGFTCVGYVGWESEKGSHRRVLFAGPSGVFSMSVEAVDEEWKTDAGATALAKLEADNGWFWSQDPEKNHVLREIATGTLGDIEAEFGLSLALFRQWLTEAGVPFAGAVEPRDMVRVARLFVPQGMSRIERDNLLEHLYRKSLLLGAGAEGTTPLVTSEGVSVGESSVEPALTVLDLPYFADEKKALVDSVSKPVDELTVPATGWTFKGPLSTKEGGSKPVYEVEAPDGTLWVFKPHKELQRPAADRAAYEFSELLKPNNNPVGLAKIKGAKHGGVGSVQPKIDGKILKSGDTEAFDDQDIAEVMGQHVVDMFLGDHDGHGGNWLRARNPDGSKGPLVAIDKGQSFKFAVFKIQGKTIAGSDPTESLDPFDATWQSAPGNHGEHLAKKMLRKWLSKGTLPESAVRAMQQTLNRLTDISDAQLQKFLTPVAKANQLSAPQTKKLYEVYRQRRDTMKNQWRDIIREHLGPDWNWPGEAAAPTVAMPKQKTLLDRTPQEIGFTEVEKQYIADAIDAGWAGKSIAMDRDAIENQNVVIKTVTAKTGKSTGPGTLVHWRVPKHAGVRAAKRLYPKATLNETPEYKSAGLQLSKIDDHFRLYYRIHLAADNLDFVASSGYVEGQTPVFNEAYFALAQQVSMELDKLDVATKDPAGWYTVGDGDDAFAEPNPVVQDLVAHLRSLLTALTTKRTQVETTATLPLDPGAILKAFEPFKWLDDGTYQKPTDLPSASALYDVIYATGNARWPNIEPDAGGTLTLKTSLTAPAKTLSMSMPQFIISHGSLAIHFAPPHGGWREEVKAKSYGVSNVQSWEGVCWAFIPGQPNPSLVAKVMNLWQDATGIETKKPDPVDRDILWLMKQAQVSQTVKSRKVLPSGAADKVQSLPFGTGGGVVVLARTPDGRTRALRAYADYTTAASTITLLKKLQPGETAIVTRPAPISTNDDNEAINSPVVQSAWDLYKELDTLSAPERQKRQAQIIKKLRSFVADTTGLSEASVAKAMEAHREGQYDRQRVQQEFDPETVEEHASQEGVTVFTGKLAVPKGTKIAPGTITLTLRIGATTLYVQDQYAEASGSTGTLRVKQVSAGGEVEVNDAVEQSINYKTGVLRLAMTGKIKTTPAPAVEFFVEGTPADGVQLGVGIRHHRRVGWDRDGLKSLLIGDNEKPVFIGHKVGGGLSSFWPQVLQNGALLANYLRPMYGVPIKGASADSDLNKGATGTFSCMRRGVTQTNALFFDLDLALRTDVYTAGSGDDFGSVSKPQYRGPEVWAQNSLNDHQETISTGSSWQFVLRDAIDLRDYLVFAVVDSESTAKSLIKMCYDNGWTSFWRGRPPEEVIVTRDGAKARYKDVL